MNVSDDKIKSAMEEIKHSSDEALRNYFDTGDKEMLGEYRAYTRALNIIRKETKCSN